MPPVTDCAVLHDFLLLNGGAEKLVDTLATAFDAPLVTAFATHPQDWAAAKGRLRLLGTPAGGRAARYLVAAHRFLRLPPALLAHDAIVYSGVIAPLAVHRQRSGRRIHYCHSPPRFAYDLNAFYAAQAGPAGRLGLALLNAWLRPRYAAALRAMDLVIANSENVRNRLRRYLGIDATVVPPPIDTARFRWRGQEDFYLSTARLEDFKRVDVIVEAFRRMPRQRLVVASGGSQEAALRASARGCANIHFTSWLDAPALADLVGRCRATIYLPQDEDFGMSPVESLAAGKPVIGVAEGGLLETLRDNETGVLLPPGAGTDALAAAVARLDGAAAAAMRPACESRAQDFSVERFVARMRAVLPAA